ncbi:hypothetical protein [Streptomyces sp. NRRL S-920]|uniref:hypothetical protein n=1 Tax=Streptomyces sp. NRRL S-920 TaxID=1463921 RepID=UPI000ABDC764|nr:hypothetical protein [Streptomyces sp. NRRL S-920]
MRIRTVFAALALAAAATLAGATAASANNGWEQEVEAPVTTIVAFGDLVMD